MSFLQNVASDALEITPGAAALLKPVGAIRCGGSVGDVTITTPKGTSVVFQNVQVGETIKCPATHVTAATATGLVGYIP